MVFFVLVLFTLLSFSALVITVGQVLARKALAQKLADIGALAGASEQASSLNKITEINRVSLKLLRWTGLVTRVVPFDLRYESMTGRDLEDEVRNGLDSVQTVFTTLTAEATVELSTAQSDADALASQVTAANASLLFPGEAVVAANPLPSSLLFVPTAPHTGDVYWGYFTSDCFITPFTPFPVCNLNPFSPTDHWNYWSHCATYTAYFFGDTDDKTLTTYFTRADKNAEIHYYWQVTVPATGAILGIFPPLPAVTAVAKAKPYGGYTGDQPTPESISTDLWPYAVLPCTCPDGPANNLWSDMDVYHVEHEFLSTFQAKLDAITRPQDGDLLDWMNTNYDPLDEVLH